MIRIVTILSWTETDGLSYLKQQKKVSENTLDTSRKKLNQIHTTHSLKQESDGFMIENVNLYCPALLLYSPEKVR